MEGQRERSGRKGRGREGGEREGETVREEEEGEGGREVER